MEEDWATVEEIFWESKSLAVMYTPRSFSPGLTRVWRSTVQAKQLYLRYTALPTGWFWEHRSQEEAEVCGLLVWKQELQQTSRQVDWEAPETLVINTRHQSPLPFPLSSSNLEAPYFGSA